MACSLQTQQRSCEEDDVEGVATFMDEEARPEGERRKTPAIIVRRVSRGMVALSEGGSSLKGTERERGRKTTSTQTSPTKHSRMEEQEPG